MGQSAAIYCRVSTADQTCARQERDLKAFAKKAGYKIVGVQFDLRTAQGKLIASLMVALAEFERDLLRERVRSGIAAARKRGVVFGRQLGQRVKADRHAPRVLKLAETGQSYREISHRLGISKNTVLNIVKRDRAV